MNSTENVFGPLGELREQLNILKKNRATNWEEDVAKLVGLVANDLSSQKDPVTALKEASMITLAASSGNRHAKKRIIKPTLWLTEPPPSINKFLNKQDEQCAAIKLLSLTKSEWIIPYILDELVISTDNVVRSNFLDWLIKTTDSGLRFIESINSIKEIPPEITQDVWAVEILEYLTNQISKKKLSINQDFFSGIGKFISSQINQFKNIDEIQIKTLELVNQASNVKPAVIYSSQLASLLSIFENNRSTKNKVVADLVKKIETKISDINKSIVLTDKSDLDVITLRLDESLHKISTQYKGILLQTRPAEKEPQNINDHETENVIVSLISNWDEYIENEDSTPATEQLSAKFNLLLDKFLISKFSTRGTVEPYDPIKHELINSSNPIDVLVIKSGYGKVRPDGSIRVLIKALVQ